MKKTLLALCLMSGFIFSCKKSDVSNDKQTQKTEESSARTTSGGGDRVCGSEFAPFGLEGRTLREVVDYAGQKHNEYQAFLYESIASDPSIVSSDAFQGFLKDRTREFFYNIGINQTTNPLPGNTSLWGTSFVTPEDFSDNARSLVDQLELIRSNYTDEAHDEAIAQLSALKEEALDLESFDEAVIVGLSVSVLSSSYQYWQANIDNWISMLAVPDDFGAKQRPCGIEVKKIGGADVVGAYSGATGGWIAGPGGSFAGGVLGAAVGSSGAVLWEAAKCIPVVGDVVRWLSDWF